MSDADTWFLLVQYKRAGRTVVTEFDDPIEAATAYGETERKFEDRIKGPNRTVDVLLVGASSLDVVKQHYPSYFMNATSPAGKIRALLAGLPAHTSSLDHWVSGQR